MRKELLKQSIDYDYQILNEDIDINGVKTKRLRGPLSEGDIENRNNRVYPKYLLEREVERLLPDIKARQVIGELDHPDDLKIHLDRVSHVITEATWEGNKLMGTIEILPHTTAGKNLLGLVQSGIRLGISSRGMGSVRQQANGKNVVQEDLRLITWDVVAQPSNYSSWLSLTESANPIYLDDIGYIGENVEPKQLVNIEHILRGKSQISLVGFNLDQILRNGLKKNN
jgi:hypothetical protein